MTNFQNQDKSAKIQVIVLMDKSKENENKVSSQEEDL